MIDVRIVFLEITYIPLRDLSGGVRVEFWTKSSSIKKNIFYVTFNAFQMGCQKLENKMFQNWKQSNNDEKKSAKMKIKSDGLLISIIEFGHFLTTPGKVNESPMKNLFV